MGNDNQAKHRQASKLKRKAGAKPPYDRILIVCEGEKTEVQYFRDMISDKRLPTAHVRVAKADGTDPVSVVNSAIAQAKNYERVFAVFDRDSHEKYDEALKIKTSVEKIISVSCFEFWLLLHYEEQTQFIDRKTALHRMKIHIPSYSKGKTGVYAETSPHYDKAKAQALRLRENHTEKSGTEPFTNVDMLVDVIINLKRDI